MRLHISNISKTGPGKLKATLEPGGRRLHRLTQRRWLMVLLRLVSGRL